MSDLDLREFQTYLSEKIDNWPKDQSFDPLKIIGELITKHPAKLQKIQNKLYELGLRTLIKNDCRTKKQQSNQGPDFFRDNGFSKRVSVPRKDGNGKLSWDKKPPSDLTFEELDDIRDFKKNHPRKMSSEERRWAKLAEEIQPFRGQAKSVAEALEMARRKDEDG